MQWLGDNLRGRSSSRDRDRHHSHEHSHSHSHSRDPERRERKLSFPSPKYSEARPRTAEPIPMPQPFVPLGVPSGQGIQTSHSYNGPYGAAPSNMHFPDIQRVPTPYAYNQPVPQQPRPRANSTGYHHTTHTTHVRVHKHSRSHSHTRPPQPHVQFASAPVQIPTHSQSHTHLRMSSQPQPPHHSALHIPPRPQKHPAPVPSQHHRLPAFRYSTCTGRRKALCIGINYKGMPNELRGCVNDAKNVRNFLVRKCNYKEGDIVLLVDDSRNPRQIPTRRNILDAMRWLVQSAKPNDSLFFHYSGHGGQTPDLDGDETDGFDEVIFPLDFRKRGHIVDDEMHEIMVHPLPIGCRLTALFDSCHSGTALDLPYIYHSNGRLKGSHVSDRARRRKGTPADVISWSGSRDDQTSADTFSQGLAVGAMSNAFVALLTQMHNPTYIEFLKALREMMRKKYSQKPQLSSSHPIDTNLRFII